MLEAMSGRGPDSAGFAIYKNGHADQIKITVRSEGETENLSDLTDEKRAGLDGMENNRDPGKRLDINMYTEGHLAKEAKKLPLNLLDALRALEASSALREQLGSEFIDAFVKLKRIEWTDYTHHLTDWERDNTLDC